MGDKIVTLNQVLNNKDFENEFDVIVINDDIPVSFTKEDYNVKEGEPQYTDAEKDQFCRFCYNIQDGVKINYYNGGNEPIEKVYGTLEESKFKIIKERNEENNKYKNYSINIRTSTFHLMSKNCCSIKNIEKKYIQETRAAEDEILSKGFKLCKRCN